MTKERGEMLGIVFLNQQICNMIRHPSTGRPVDGDSSQPKFPRIEDCAHFHYEAVDYGRIKVITI